MTRRCVACAGVLALMLASGPAMARTSFVGGPLHQEGMAIVAGYRDGVAMAPMPPGMPGAGPDVINLEAQLHAMAGNPFGYGEGDWVGYLTIDYAIRKDATDWQAKGRLLPMTSQDGPRYAANLKMDGPGLYHLTYTLHPPGENGLLRATGPDGGVPDWWRPFSVDFTFNYPQP